MSAYSQGAPGKIAFAAVMLALGLVGVPHPGWAQQGEAGGLDLNELCAHSAPESPSTDREEQESYHQQRRRLVHQIHKVTIEGVDESLVDYDRVTGLLTINGFRAFVPGGQSTEIGLRNQCIVGFEVQEQEAPDVMAQLVLGAAKLEIGFLLAAHDDFEAEFCVTTDGGWPRVMVDLLYARLLSQEDGQERSVAAYQTPLGHRLALRQSTLVVDAARRAMPEVKVSHFQWRARGKEWSESFQDEPLPEGLEQVQAQTIAEMERAIYPCYIRALSRNASLQGAMVLEVGFSQGAEASPRFLMNTLNDEQIDECVQGQLKGLNSPAETMGPGGVDGFKATVLMRHVHEN